MAEHEIVQTGTDAADPESWAIRNDPAPAADTARAPKKASPKKAKS